MNFSLKTSKKTQDTLKSLEGSTRLAPNILARLAINLSLLDPAPIAEKEADTAGIDFRRPTLTGSYDLLFKCLIAQHAGRHLSDEEYFPFYVKQHLERGAIKLENEYKHAGNFEKFVNGLLFYEAGDRI